MSNKLPMVFVLSLCTLVLPASGQSPGFSNIGHIGPSTAEVVGVAIGAGAAIGLVMYLAIPKQATIEGCIEAVDGTNWITDGKNKQKYQVVAVDITLKTGQRLKLKGKKHKDKSGSRQFTVKKVVEDKGACGAEPAVP